MLFEVFLQKNPERLLGIFLYIETCRAIQKYFDRKNLSTVVICQYVLNFIIEKIYQPQSLLIFLLSDYVIKKNTIFDFNKLIR